MIRRFFSLLNLCATAWIYLAHSREPLTLKARMSLLVSDNEFK